MAVVVVWAERKVWVAVVVWAERKVSVVVVVVVWAAGAKRDVSVAVVSGLSR